MADNTPRKLTDKQLTVLKLLYRFRFGTSELMAKAQGGITSYAMRARLTVLEEKELIGKKRDGRAQLEGRPAIYYLAPKGKAVLREESSKYSEKILNAMRATKPYSKEFIDHHLTVFLFFNILHVTYGDGLIFLTKNNMAAEKFHYLPDFRPDGFLYLQKNNHHYLLYVLKEPTPDFALVHTVAPIFEYQKSGKWQTEARRRFPTILLFCSSKRLETTMRRRFKKLVARTQSNVTFATTTQERVVEHKAWRKLGDDDAFYRLEEI